MTRRRKLENKDLPDNVYIKTVKGIRYYVFEHPITHKSKSFGSDKEKAIRLANELNNALWSQGIVDRAPKIRGVKCKELAKDYYDWKTPQLRAKSSVKDLKYNLNRFVASFGEKAVSTITTQQLYAWLSDFTDDMYRRIKSQLSSMFDFAIATGARTDNVNPARLVLHKKRPKRQRKRLQREHFDAIYSARPRFLIPSPRWRIWPISAPFLATNSIKFLAGVHN